MWIQTSVHHADITVEVFSRLDGSSHEFAALKYGPDESRVTVFLSEAQVRALAVTFAEAVATFDLETVGKRDE